MGTYREYETASATRRQSGLGIASFVVSLIGGLLIFLMVSGVIYLIMTGSGDFDENSGEMVALALLLLAGCFADVIAMGLGIAALFQTECKKSLAILGIVFSFLALAGIGGLIVLGSLPD